MHIAFFNLTPAPPPFCGTHEVTGRSQDGTMNSFYQKEISKKNRSACFR